MEGKAPGAAPKLLPETQFVRDFLETHSYPELTDGAKLLLEKQIYTYVHSTIAKARQFEQSGMSEPFITLMRRAIHFNQFITKNKQHPSDSKLEEICTNYNKTPLPENIRTISGVPIVREATGQHNLLSQNYMIGKRPPE
eukprot:gnl/Chilomastix_cuspidata/5676.p1 GENE.gnl/Chilomastix_cuspidata/5676~~gnl/Chilomastix_cuspidata/5676.p1  ORF type:complete len:140 (+),score=32.59 gnl/Chilomastix_cuspidata/5676:181-600(+)